MLTIAFMQCSVSRAGSINYCARGLDAGAPGIVATGSTELTQLRYSASQRRAFCLRQHGACRSSVCCFEALRASKQHTTKKEKYRQDETQSNNSIERGT